MPNGTYGGVRGRKTKVGRKLLRFPPTRLVGRKLLRFPPTRLFHYVDVLYSTTWMFSPQSSTIFLYQDSG